MKTFSIITLGCKVNQYESCQIRQFLEQLGLRSIKLSQKPDLAIINTCCVTRTASAKSRQQIHNACKSSSNTTIVICGCLPIVQNSELQETVENIHIISNRHQIASTLNRLIAAKSTAPKSAKVRCLQHSLIKSENRLKVKPKKDLEPTVTLPLLTNFYGHTRAFLKVQDGCDSYCTYCIIPKARPKVHSKPIKDVVKEAKALVAAGHKEIVITGVFLGAYGHNTTHRRNWSNPKSDRLAHLLEELASIDGLSRIRLSSLEPGDITDRLLDIFCSFNNIMPHLHLSLQSGSDNVLKKMARQYRIEAFRNKVRLIRSRLDKPALTTDVIVGFPGESDKDFQDTIDFVLEISFSKIHVFRFSAREGTAAAKMQPAVKKEVIKERSAILRKIDRQLQSDFREQFITTNAQVLLESDGREISGRAERYFIVKITDTSKKLKKNKLVNVKLIKNLDDCMLGQAISKIS